MTNLRYLLFVFVVSFALFPFALFLASTSSAQEDYQLHLPYIL